MNKSPILCSILFLIVVGCTSPPKRLTVEESRFYSTQFELGKRYDNLLTILQEELGTIEKEKEFYRAQKHDEHYPGDLEGKLFILDDLAEIYTSGLVDFEKAFEKNKEALELYNEIQGVGIQNLLDSPYFNLRRRLYYYFYPNKESALLVEEGKSLTVQITTPERIANEFRGEVVPGVQISYFTPFPKEFLTFVRQMDLE